MSQRSSDIAGSITDSSPDCDVALFVPYVFIESAMGVVGDKLNVGAEVCYTILYLFNMYFATYCVKYILQTTKLCAQLL